MTKPPKNDTRQTLLERGTAQVARSFAAMASSHRLMQDTKGIESRESTSDRLARIQARGYANLTEWEQR